MTKIRVKTCLVILIVITLLPLSSVAHADNSELLIGPDERLSEKAACQYISTCEAAINTCVNNFNRDASLNFNPQDITDTYLECRKSAFNRAFASPSDPNTPVAPEAPLSSSEVSNSQTDSNGIVNWVQSNDFRSAVQHASIDFATFGVSNLVEKTSDFRSRYSPESVNIMYDRQRNRNINAKLAYSFYMMYSDTPLADLTDQQIHSIIQRGVQELTAVGSNNPARAQFQIDPELLKELNRVSVEQENGLIELELIADGRFVRYLRDLENLKNDAIVWSTLAQLNLITGGTGRPVVEAAAASAPEVTNVVRFVVQKLVDSGVYNFNKNLVKITVRCRTAVCESNVADLIPTNNLVTRFGITRLQNLIDNVNYNFLINIRNVPRPSRSNPINLAKAEEWINAHPDEETKAAARAIIQNTTHISQQEFERALTTSVEDLNSQLDTGTYALISDVGSSNSWVDSLAIPQLRALPAQILEISNTPGQAIQPGIKQLVYLDDAAYSGGQAMIQIRGLLRRLQNQGSSLDGVKIYYVIPFMSSSAEATIRSLEQEFGVSIIIARHQNMKTLNDLVTPETFNTIKKMYPLQPGEYGEISPDINLRYLGQVALTYFDHKIPDSVSILGENSATSSQLERGAIYLEGYVKDITGRYLTLPNSEELFNVGRLVPETVPPYH